MTVKFINFLKVFNSILDLVLIFSSLLSITADLARTQSYTHLLILLYYSYHLLLLKVKDTVHSMFQY